MDYCKICKAKLEYRGKIETVTGIDYQTPMFYCPVCKRDVKQAEVLRFEDLLIERVGLLEIENNLMLDRIIKLEKELGTNVTEP